MRMCLFKFAIDTKVEVSVIILESSRVYNNLHKLESLFKKGK